MIKKEWQQVIDHVRNIKYDLENSGSTTTIPLDLLIPTLETWFSQDENEINNHEYSAPQWKTNEARPYRASPTSSVVILDNIGPVGPQ